MIVFTATSNSNLSFGFFKNPLYTQPKLPIVHFKNINHAYQMHFPTYTYVYVSERQDRFVMNFKHYLLNKDNINSYDTFLESN